ncbi:uncharacterized protein LOC133824469 [Humulus lupulus]|uniref:uncharacterized protein LOC133824469 n=1 Tax=Humulus lupulus TaxID=3486 RepID=UPI002B40B278|nr:uncharacterized protein LOC133824469 [Humulus lupulus]
MESINVFDIYSTHEAAAAPPSKKKTSKRHHGESSKVPQAKKAQNAGHSEDTPSATTTPSSPYEHQIPPAPAGLTPPPAAPTDRTQQADPASTGGDITGRAFKLVKERVAKTVNHDRCREAMAMTEAMDVDLILNRALNEFTSVNHLFLQKQTMLTLTTGCIQSGIVTEQARTLEQQHEDELKAAEKKYAKQLAVVVEEKAKLAKELEEKQRSLDKVREQREQFKESNRFNFRAAQQLKVDLVASRQETTTLEGRIEELEKANANNLERRNGKEIMGESSAASTNGKNQRSGRDEYMHLMSTPHEQIEHVSGQIMEKYAAAEKEMVDLKSDISKQELKQQRLGRSMNTLNNVLRK